MLNKCLNFRLRTKQGLKIYYCARKRTTIDFKLCSICPYKEYKKVYNIATRKPLGKCNKKHKTTIATSITKEVKLKVWERDNYECIFCHKRVSWNFANSHYIKRSHLGLGIEENIFTACPVCHYEFDDTPKREYMLPIAKQYLISKYDYWNEEMLVYKKWRD